MLIAALYNALSFTAGGIRRLASPFAIILRNRAALKHMSELDDRTLADIGLTRSDLITASARPLYSDPLLVDPFAARRRIHANDLNTLARLPRQVPEQTYCVKPVICSATPAE
ncbi:DUF1127 domain-containing protein [Cohaesibacter celericrescens]|jgi:uncharacterized protein YjiS (DUF1127 family)|uniref:DUF1127 domain-containing protein n=1 Tax=Cohaesibacter celericrescens TaxID=2067669 RepID=UPI0035614BF4